jgi:hypothetical protein
MGTFPEVDGVYLDLEEGKTNPIKAVKRENAKLLTDLEGKLDGEYIDDEEEEDDDLDWLENLKDEGAQEEGTGDGEVEIETIIFDT